jgi:diguanylate cyclase (GGDEF)-like protein
LIARVGGEELAFVGADLSTAQTFKELNLFRETVETVLIEEGGDTINPTISIGFAILKTDENVGKDFNELIQFSDEALYKPRKMAVTE